MAKQVTKRNETSSDPLRPFVADALNQLRRLQPHVASVEDPCVPLPPDLPPHEHDQGVKAFSPCFLDAFTTLDPPLTKLLVSARLKTVEITSLQTTCPDLPVEDTRKQQV
jgi:hypothetical protein